MTSLPADYWGKRGCVGLVAEDRTHVLFRPCGETLDIALESPTGDELAAASLPAGMIYHLMDALAAWQGNGKLLGDGALCTCESPTT